MGNAATTSNGHSRTRPKGVKLPWVLLSLVVGTCALIYLQYATIVGAVSSFSRHEADALLPLVMHMSSSSAHNNNTYHWENATQALETRIEILEKEIDFYRLVFRQHIKEMHPQAVEQQSAKQNNEKRRKQESRQSDKNCGDNQVRVEPIHLSSSVDKHERPPWCLDVPVPPQQTQFYLGIIVHVRIYAYDLPKLSTRDLVHWLTYHRYAGVERVYLFDTYVNDTEQLLLDPDIRNAIASGFVVYTNYHDVALDFYNLKHSGGPRKPNVDHLSQVQAPAYKVGHALAHNETRWSSFHDMDEYPYVANDTAPGFLARWLRRKEESERDVGECDKTTEFRMPNYLVEGGRGDASRGPMLIQQIPRLDKTESNGLVKQIVRLDAAKGHGVHHSSVHFGQDRRMTGEDIMLKHFWGGRRLGWRRVDELNDEERAALYDRTIENDMDGIPEQVLRCF